LPEPSGEFVRGSEAYVGGGGYRPAHLHDILEADGFETLTTHIFDPDDPYIHSDAVFGVKESLMAKFDLADDRAAIAAAGFKTPCYLVEQDFVLASSES
jgi:catechol 1,2-dioxygenase